MQLTQFQVANEALNENKDNFQKNLRTINETEIVEPFIEGYTFKSVRKPSKAFYKSPKLILIIFLALGLASSLFLSVSSLFLNALVKPTSTLPSSTSLNQEKSRELTNRELCIGAIDETVEKSFKLKGEEAIQHMLLVKKLYLDTNINGATFLDICKQEISEEELENFISAVKRLDSKF